MKKYILPLYILLVLSIQFIPLVSLAQDADFVAGKSLVPCGNDQAPPTYDSKGKETDDSRKILNPCTFKDVFLIINNLIEFIFKFMVVPIAAIMFAYAGFQMLFSGGNAGKYEQAKGIFMNVFVGLVIAAAAWLIVHEVLILVGFNGKAFGLE